MKIIYRILILFFLGFVFSSCATTIKVEVEHPPLVDMRGVKKVSVIPFENQYKPDSVTSRIIGNILFLNRQNIFSSPERSAAEAAINAISQEMTNAIINTNAYTLIDPNSLSKVEVGDYAKFVDVFIVGELNHIDITYSKKKVKVYEGQSHGEDKWSEREVEEDNVHLKFNYRFIRASDRKILYTIAKKGGDSDYERSAQTIAVDIVKKQLANMARELVPYISIEEYKLMDDKKKDPSMKNALKLIDAKNYIDALRTYNAVYKQTGNYAAGYNAALLTEILGDLNGAIKMMGELLDRLNKDSQGLKSAAKTRLIVAKEFSRMQKYYIDARTLMDYKKPK